jgi:hypothetical protein
VKCAWVGIMIAKVLTRNIAIVRVAVSFLLNYQCPTFGWRILDAGSVARSCIKGIVGTRYVDEDADFAIKLHKNSSQLKHASISFRP